MQTDLQAATGSTARWIEGMESGYPSHTDGTSSSGMREVQFQGIATSSQANIAWNEWTIQNSSGGRALNRKVQSIGTKTSAVTRTITITLGIS